MRIEEYQEATSLEVSKFLLKYWIPDWIAGQEYGRYVR